VRRRLRGDHPVMSRRLISAALALLCASPVLCPCDARAQWSPSRPIQLVTGNPPGGATDVIARTLAQPLSARLGQNVIIDNRPGANGNISAEIVAKARPDGHTILYANNSLVVVNPHIYTGWTLNPLEALTPVVTTISNQLVLAVNPKSIPVDDFRGFLEFARKPGSSLLYASIGNGSQHHLAMELLKQKAGIEMTHIPYRGGGPAAIAVISGDNHLMFGGSSVVPHIKAGKLKGLAVTDKKGWETMPDMPGIGEFLPGYRIALWHGIFAPKGTPKPILDRLRTDLNAVLAMPDVKERLVSTGAGEPYVTTPEEFAALIKADYEAYGQVIKAIGLKVD
jgi:tripartite-type tricarboxylate transporter receptor subunit TctC